MRKEEEEEEERRPTFSSEGKQGGRILNLSSVCGGKVKDKHC